MFPAGTYGSIAIDDLDSANILLNYKKYNASVSSSHQAVEKILKQYLQQNDRLRESDVHTQDLVALMRQANIGALTRYKELITAMSGCYESANYPGEYYNRYTEYEASSYLEAAARIVETVIDYCLFSDSTIAPTLD